MCAGPSDAGPPVTAREEECNHPPRTLPVPRHQARDLAALLMSDQPELLSDSSVRVWVEEVALQGVPFVRDLIAADGLAPLVDAAQTATTSGGETVRLLLRDAPKRTSLESGSINKLQHNCWSVAP